MDLDFDGKVIRYLKQTRDIYGDKLFLEQYENQLASTNPSSLAEISDSKYSNNLKNFYHQINQCRKCELGSSRTNFVFGIGDPRASLVLIGEAPGEKEDKIGEPFVGRAGKLLDKILKAINLTRNRDVFICNVIKCRPPNNRDPKENEIKECEPYLIHQINLIRPKLIVALGRVAGKTLLNVDNSLKSMRGVLHKYCGTPLVVTYHPAALLRNPSWKPEAWKDFKWIRSILNN